MATTIRIDVDVSPGTRAAIQIAAAKAGYTTVRGFLRDLLTKRFPAAEKPPRA